MAPTRPSRRQQQCSLLCRLLQLLRDSLWCRLLLPYRHSGPRADVAGGRIRPEEGWREPAPALPCAQTPTAATPAATPACPPAAHQTPIPEPAASARIAGTTLSRVWLVLCKACSQEMLDGRIVKSLTKTKVVSVAQLCSGWCTFGFMHRKSDSRIPRGLVPGRGRIAGAAEKSRARRRRSRCRIGTACGSGGPAACHGGLPCGFENDARRAEEFETHDVIQPCRTAPGGVLSL